MVFFSSWWYNWWYGVNKLGAVNAYATTLPAKGPYDSVQLGMLKQLDKMVNELEKSSGTQVHLTMLLRERAMSALPDNTAALLQVRTYEMIHKHVVDAYFKSNYVQCVSRR